MQHPPPEALLSHSQWLRRLALRLAADEATADDLLQDTWLAALRKPPRAEGVRHWLGRVLVNAARQRKRSGSRRDSREERVARTESAVPSAQDLAIRLEESRRLLAFVSELKEPYRTAVLLRYDEGLSSVEIAAQLDVPAATVRTRLHRALADLRQRMDERSGGRAAWASILVPAQSAPEGALLEVIGMSTATKVALAGATVALALAGAWSAVNRSDVTPTTAPADVPPEPSVSLVGEDNAVPGDVPSVSATEQRAPVAEPPPLDDPAATTHRFEARVTDERGLPITGARLLWREHESTPSAADGGVALSVERAAFGARSVVRVDADGYLPLELELAPSDAERTSVGDVTLAGGAVLTGTVLDQNGQPLPAVRVALTWAHPVAATLEQVRRHGPRMPELWNGASETESDVDGRFEFRSFGTGTRSLWAGSAGYLWSIEGPIAIAAGDALDVSLVLAPAERGMRIRGVVLDPEGRAVPQAHLWFYADPGRGKSSGKADAEGRFDLLLEVDEPHELRAVHPAGTYSESMLQGVEPGATDVVLQFVRTRPLDIVPLGRGGLPIAESEVWALNASDDNFIAEGGESLLEPSEPFHIRIRADGYAQGTFGPFEPGALPDTAEFQLTPVEELTGSVTAGGVALEGAAIEVYGSIGNQVVYHRGLRVTRYPFSFLDDETDAHGRFALTPREAQDFLVRVRAAGYAALEQEVRGYDPSTGAELEFALTPGGSISGVVLPLPGKEPTGLLVIASRGDAHERTQRVGPDGAFYFEHLSPGPWFVEVTPDDLSDAGATFLSERELPELDANCVVVEGEEIFVELDLARAPRAILEGRLQVDDAPAHGWSVGLEPRDRPSGRPSEFPKATSDDGGRFRLETPVLGAHTLRLGAPQGIAVSVPLELEHGSADWQLALFTASLELANVPPSSERYFRPHLSWSGSRGMTARVELSPDALGSARLEGIPAGSYEVRHHPGGARTPALVIERFELAAGASERIVLP